MAEQTLSLSQSQQLQMVLAPQLRQSLEMLQLPILELRALIQKELEQNPTVEESATKTEPIEPRQDTGETAKKDELDFDKEFEALAKLDSEWRDYFYQNLQMTSYSRESEEKRQFLFESLPQRQSLQENLMEQLNFTDLPEPDKQIGKLIIGNINDDGYLTSSMEELSSSAGFDIEHMKDILSVVQDFHPTGVASRDLSECLLLQLERLGSSNPLAAELIRNHLPELGAKKYKELEKNLGVSHEELMSAVKLISTLDPKPGRFYTTEDTSYILPEVVVKKIDGKYVIILNDDQLPHLRISKQYRDILANPDTPDDVRNYVKEKIRAGAFMIKSIHQRQRTIYRIAQEIVSSQTEFLDMGVSHLKPLTMSEIAGKVGVHETTVSRTVANKYMQTPGGIYEMKYFFTPGIKTTDGKELSNKAVQDMIAGFVNNEDPAQPLSDQELVDKLGEQGVHIARRTIAKYRLALRIPSSHARKIQ